VLVHEFVMKRLIVDNEELHEIECVINEKMKWIVCTRCDRGVPSEYLQAHLWAKHKINCSDDTLNTIITGRELKTFTSLKNWKKNTVALEAAIGGIAIERGHKCVECGHCTPKWGSMTDHFLKHHEGKDAKECTEAGIRMQAPFGGELKKWFEIIDNSAMEVDEENESAWEVVKALLAKKRRKAQASIGGREENVRLLSGFVARTRWDVLIEGHDKKELRTLAAIAKEKDPLYKIMETSEKYFSEISDKLRMGDVLLRRKIESEG
jgi:Orsellinic acid/F9775 biosynthesis cluster protein D